MHKTTIRTISLLYSSYHQSALTVAYTMTQNVFDTMFLTKDSRILITF